MAATGPRFCSQCGRPLTEGANFCSSCGAQTGALLAPPAPPAAISKPVSAPASPRPKSVAIAVVLAIVPAMFGFLGIGHFYLERFRRGLLILFGTWLLAVLAIAVVVLSFQTSTMMGPEPTIIIVAIAVYLGIFALLVWQVVDAVALVKRWNRLVAETGHRPW